MVGLKITPGCGGLEVEVVIRDKYGKVKYEGKEVTELDGNSSRQRA
jgi:hypothetical protein